MNSLTKSVVFVVATLMLAVVPLQVAHAQAQPARQAQAGAADTLTVAMSSLFEETFFPWLGGALRQFYLSAIYEFLVYLDPKTEQPKPGLATKWEMSRDGKTWTFYLRKGVQFHEGWGELTAEDVRYTFEKQMATDSKGSNASMLRDSIAKVEAPERYKVVFTFKKPDIDFATGNGSNTSEGLIVCKKYVETVGDEKANAHPIGTGPYTLAEYRRGSSIKLQMVPGAEKHWRLKPYFKTITFLRVPEEATRVAMLKAGEVDLAPISYDSIDSIKAAGLRVVSVPKTWVPVIRLGGLVLTDPQRYNPKNPWADKRVRQAMNYAVDKDGIVNTIFHGEATPAGVDSPIAEWFGIKPYPYDPKRAKQLLAEAGFANGFPVTLKTYTTSPGAELPMIGEAIAMYWKAIGIDVKIVPVDYGSLRGEWASGKGLTNDFTWVHRGMAFGSPVFPLQINHNTANTWATFVTKDVETRSNQIQSELDFKKRDLLLTQMGEFLRDEASFVFVAFANEPYGASRKVGEWLTPRVVPQNIEAIRPLK